MTKLYPQSFPGLKNAGFTLIELLVVVLIIGILAAVALPKYEMAVAKAEYTHAMTMAKSLFEAQQRCFLANGKSCEHFDELDIGLPADASVAPYSDTGETMQTKRLKCDLFFSGNVSCKAVRGTDYFIAPGYSRYKDGRTFCIAWNEEAGVTHKLCKSMGGVFAETGLNNEGGSTTYTKYLLP